jgi:CheY-like chemotaxis protein
VALWLRFEYLSAKHKTDPMKKFLLVDDEDIFNYLNSEVIQLVNKDYQPQAFCSGREALDYLQKILQERDESLPDVILLDIRMPGMNGFEFLDELMKCDTCKLENTAVYVLSSSLDHRDMERAHSYPLVRGFRSKPLSEEMVMEMVEKLPN